MMRDDEEIHWLITGPLGAEWVTAGKYSRRYMRADDGFQGLKKRPATLAEIKAHWPACALASELEVKKVKKSILLVIAHEMQRH